jgi:hypothetical protein
MALAGEIIDLGRRQVRHEQAAVRDRIHVALARIEHGDYPDRARLEHMLTDGYACALSLDAECDRIEKTIAEHAARLGGDITADDARELSTLARLLARRRGELAGLREQLTALRAGVQQARVA